MTKIQWEIITKAVPLELMSTVMRKMRRTRTAMRKISNSMELMPVRTSMQREEGKERRRERFKSKSSGSSPRGLEVTTTSCCLL